MSLTTLVLAITLLGAAPTEKKMNAKTFFTIEFQGGRAWRSGLPPEKQDLAAHFAQVKADFEQGALLGNGPLAENFHGFYIYDVADGQALKARIERSEEVKKGVLEVVAAAPWHVVIDNSSVDVAGRDLFVLEYAAGAAYVKGKPIDQQVPKLVKAHLDYVGVKAASGSIYLGGPVDPLAGRGRYILIASSKSDVQAFVSDDPAVRGALFTVEVKTWKPFQRQPSRGAGHAVK